ncbi:MAG: ABC transporter ATP-binding protein [Planctomycetota bacterium]
MKNLTRALRMTLKYKWSLIASFTCSIFVALLWSANLGAVYPFVEIVLKGKSLHDWVDDERHEASRMIAENLYKREELQNQLVRLDPDAITFDRQEIVDSVAEIDPSADLSQFQLVDFKLKDFQVAGDAQKLSGLISIINYDLEVQTARLSTRVWMAPWIENYAPRDPFETLAWLMGLMFFGTVFRGMFLMGSMVSVARVGQRTMLDMQNGVFQNVLELEASEVGVKGTGDLVGRIRGETNRICQAITTLFGKTIREPLKMAGCLTGAALVNWRLLLFSMLICPLAGFLMVWLARVTKKANRRAMEESARLLNRLYQALTYLRVVKAFTNEQAERDRFEVVANDVYRRSMRISIFGALSRINNELLGVSMITLSVLAGGYLVLNTTVFLFGVRMSAAPMSFGELILFFGFLIGIADPLRKMGDVYNMIQGGVVAADRVFPLMDQVPQVKNPEDPLPLPDDGLDIVFDDVRFQYEAGNPILNGVTAQIPAGSSLAIIGHNGCGKSTLINLIPRFFDACATVNGPSGAIRIGGLDVRDVAIEDLRNKIGYVTQQTMLFSESIEDNIGYGDETASHEAIVAAAKKAHADKFIRSIDGGYSANIGEHGGRLSGGQRQRLSLARAILKNPEILILDEATSQIDPESEFLIHQTLAEFIQGRTTVVITHRMSTLELVDRIMLMRDGQVVDCGTHEELIQRCPEYQKMRKLELVEAA